MKRIVWDRAVIENRFRCPNCNILMYLDGKPDPEIFIVGDAAGCPFCHNHVGRIFEIPEDYINNNFERRFNNNHGKK